MKHEKTLSRAVAVALHKAESLLMRGFFGAAHELAQSIEDRNPRDIESPILLAGLVQTKGDVSETIRILERCLDLKPDDSGALVAMAQALHYAGRTRDAVACCDQGLEKHPDETAFRLWKATTLDQSNDHVPAWECLQPLIARGPVSAQIAGVATRVLWGLQRYDEAITWALQAIHDPASTDSERRTLYMH